MTAHSAPKQPCSGCGRHDTTRRVVGVPLCWCCACRISVATETIKLHGFAPGHVLAVKVGLN